MKIGMKKREVVIPVRTSDVFNMIEDFVDHLIDYMEEFHSEHVDALEIVQVGKSVLNVIEESGIEGRMGIIVLLQTAASMYRVGAQQCRKDLN
jgi:hypothetical protein